MSRANVGLPTPRGGGNRLEEEKRERWRPDLRLQVHSLTPLVLVSPRSPKPAGKVN